MDFMSPPDNALTLNTLAMEVLRQEGLCPEYKDELNSQPDNQKRSALKQAVHTCLPALLQLSGQQLQKEQQLLQQQTRTCKAMVFDRWGSRRFLVNGDEVREWLADPVFYLHGENALGFLPFG